MAAASSQDTGHRPSAHLEPGSPVSLGSSVASGESDTESYHRRPQESDYPKPKDLYEDEDEDKGEDPLDIALEEDYPSKSKPKVKSPPGINRVLKDEKSKKRPDDGVASVSRKRSRKRSTPSTGRHTKHRRRKAPKRKSHSRRRNKKRSVRKAPKRKSHRRRRK